MPQYFFFPNLHSLQVSTGLCFALEQCQDVFICFTAVKSRNDSLHKDAARGREGGYLDVSVQVCLDVCADTVMLRLFCMFKKDAF